MKYEQNDSKNISTFIALLVIMMFKINLHMHHVYLFQTYQPFEHEGKVLNTFELYLICIWIILLEYV